MGGGEKGGAPRASRWARPLTRVRAPRLLPHVPRATRLLPAGSARLPPSRRVPLGLLERHTPRSSCHGRRLSRGSLTWRLSLAPQSLIPGLLPSFRHSPSLSRPSLPPSPSREPGYEAGGLEKGVGKMEVPRLDHTLNSPTSPCEEVIKNLSLEAIQLCDRDGKSDGDCEEKGPSPRPGAAAAPALPTLRARASGSFVVLPYK